MIRAEEDRPVSCYTDGMKKSTSSLNTWISKLTPGSWGWRHLLFGTALSLTGALIPTLFILPLLTSDSSTAPTGSTMNASSIALPIQFFAMFLLAVIGIRLWSGRHYKQQELGLVYPKPIHYVWAALVGAGFVGFAQLVVPLLPTVRQASETVAAQVAFTSDTFMNVIIILSMAVAAPLGEELVYRGIIMRSMYDRMARLKTTWLRALSPALPLLTSAFLFGYSHGGEGQSQQLYFLALFGVLLGILYLRYSSIYSPVFAHSVCNLVNVCLLMSSAHANNITLHPLLYVFAALTPFISIGILALTQRAIEPR